MHPAQRLTAWCARCRLRGTTRSPSKPKPHKDTKRPTGGAGSGIDLQGIIGKALDAAGIGKGSRDQGTGSRAAGSAMPIVDIQKILTTSFEAAGLLKGQGKGGKRFGAWSRSAERSGPRRH